MTDDEKRELVEEYRKQLAAHSDPDEYANRNAIRANFADRLADALEGTLTEPAEWEYLGQAFRESGSIVYQNDGLASETVEQWRKRMAYLPRVEIHRRRKAGPWEVVPDV